MKPKDTKHLRLRGNVWWFHYNLPKKLRDHPKFENSQPIITEALGTDSLSKAKQLRDKRIYELNQNLDDTYDAWLAIHNARAKANDESSSGEDAPTYREYVTDEILERSISNYGAEDVTGHPIKISKRDQLTLDVLAKKRPDKTKMLRYLTKKVILEKESEGQASKTLAKIKRSTDWLLEHFVQDDTEIALIDYDQVHEFIVIDRTKGVSGSTLKGHMFGLSQIWMRAKKSKLVSGDNPFSSHGITKDSEPYSPFTYNEVHALYDEADDAMKVLIHSAYTTGARINELLTAEVIIPSSFDSPCWMFKFKDKGKTKESTRVVPVHSSLNLATGFTFNLSDSVAQRRLRKLVDKVIINKDDECSGKPRKLSFHSFRTTLITELSVRQGMNLKIVGAVSGHRAGSAEMGSITSYINTDDLVFKKKTVERMIW